MGLHRRGFLLAASAPLIAPALRSAVVDAGIGDVHYCRVSHESFTAVAQAAYPHSIASLEPRPGFRGITFCGAQATLTVSGDRLS